MKKIFLLAFMLSLSFMLLGQTPLLPEGSGTEGSPYEIATLGNLEWLAAEATRWSAHYKQTDDIDLGVSPWNTAEGWSPIGNETTPFTGVYDGQEYTVSNLFINRPDDDLIGLFGRMQGSAANNLAELKNIKIVGVNVTGRSGVGSLLGKIDDNRYVRITRCSAIENGTTGGTVTGYRTTGGLVGANNGFPTGTPANARSKIFECFANIDVSFSFVTDEPRNAEKFGGLVGCNQRGETYDSYALGAVNGNDGDNYADRVGGFAGCVEQGLIQRCFSAGSVTGSGANIGGFVGNITGAGTGGISDSYWNTTTSGQTTSAGTGAEGLNTDGMNALTAFSTGWDPGIWFFEQGYPGLEWNPAYTEDNMLTFTGNLIHQDTDGEYQNADVGGSGYYLGFVSGTATPVTTYLIFVTYSIDPENSSVILFPSPDNLGAYCKYSVFSADENPVNISTVFSNEDYFQVQLPNEPTQLWYRYGSAGWKPLTPGSLVSGKPNYTYNISVAALDLDFSGRAELESNEIEFAGDKGGTQTLPVELSSFTAIVTADMAVNLQWTAETETNMLGYNVFRSESNSLTDAVKANFVIIPAHNTSVALDYSYVDEDVETDRLYYYWLQSNDLDLTHEFHGPISVMVEPQGEPGAILIPEIVTDLVGAYPNPFNPATAIRFSLDTPAKVSIEVYNVLGQHIKTLISDEPFTKGLHSVVWDGKDSNGRGSASGVYFYRMQTDDGFQMTKRMAIIK